MFLTQMSGFQFLNQLISQGIFPSVGTELSLRQTSLDQRKANARTKSRENNKMTLAHYTVLCLQNKKLVLLSDISSSPMYFSYVPRNVNSENNKNPLDQISAWVSLSSGESREMPQKHEERQKPGTGSLR